MESGLILGACLTMCPEAEIKERERAGLIHSLEKANDQSDAIINNVKNSRGRGRGHGQSRSNSRFLRLVKADRNKAVKAYSRPAAGVNKNTPSDLRPTRVLRKTVAYLCTNILTRTDVPFIDIYDFIFDRLRAVRQDMVIQRINDECAISLMEAIVKFHLYAEHRFTKNAPVSYDPVINQKHLNDCLKTLLSLYGTNQFNGTTRPFFEALYCLNSPESYEVISRAFQIKAEMKESPVFIDSFNICLAIQSRDFYNFFKLLDELPPLLAGFAVQRVPSMRIHALRAISVSYGVKTCKIPLEWLEDLLCYPCQSLMEKDLIRIGCQIIKSEEEVGNRLVKFDKTGPIFNADSTISVSSDVKLIILSGLNNVDVIAKEQICPWGRDLLL